MTDANTEDGKITRQTLKLSSGEFDTESIHTLKLSNKRISDLHCIGECINLERADFSHNEIVKLYNLAGLSQLNYLDLSANHISSLEGLQGLEKLEVLNLAGNSLINFEALRCLCCLEKLRELRLHDDLAGLMNPVCLLPDYKNTVLQLLPSLTMLDGERVRGQGSELFNMFREIDVALAAGRPRANMDTRKPADIPWITQDTFASSNKFQNTRLDAEQQLEKLLQGCQQLSKEAEEKLNSISPSSLSY